MDPFKIEWTKRLNENLTWGPSSRIAILCASLENNQLPLNFIIVRKRLVYHWKTVILRPSHYFNWVQDEIENVSAKSSKSFETEYFNNLNRTLALSVQPIRQSLVKHKRTAALLDLCTLNMLSKKSFETFSMVARGEYYVLLKSEILQKHKK